jgi:hypothetical protein
MPTENHGLIVMAGLAVSFWMGPALSEDIPEELHAAQMVIRAILLGTAEWAWEPEQSQDPTDLAGSPGKLDHGKARFAEKDGKLIGYVDAGTKCDSEVVLRPDGFDMATCSDGDKRFVRSGDEFKATFGSYTYTLRPAP